MTTYQILQKPIRSNQTNTTLGNYENTKWKNDRLCREPEAAVKKFREIEQFLKI